MSDDYLDSCVEVSLITCSPHEEIYSLYGHTAIRCHDKQTGEDMAFNYGIFNFRQPHFVMRFVLGHTDYELGIIDFESFCKYYESWGSEVREQVLNLYPEEKRRIIDALNTNALPENKVYRYNFFYDNCATRPRGIIEKCVIGRIVYSLQDTVSYTWRELIHEKTSRHPWAKCGNDMLLGLKADRMTTQRDRHFLPDYLSRDFSGAVIENGNSVRHLVKEDRVVVPPGEQKIERDFFLSPIQCSLLLLLACIVIVFIEYRQKKRFMLWDIVLMTAQSLAGCLIVTMFFSEHPCTSSNLQVLLLNPIPLFFLPFVLRKKYAVWDKLSGLLILLFLFGGIFQDYAEGMGVLALCLLTRVWGNILRLSELSHK